MEYEIEWQYSEDPRPVVGHDPYIHFVFMLRFPNKSLGNGHVAHFCFNVLRHPEQDDTGIHITRRGFLACVPFSKSDITNFVEVAISEAFKGNSHEVALDLLNTKFINSGIDFSNEFVDDLIEADNLLTLIEQSFDGVQREDGITLHQAMVIDDYGTQEEFLAAEELDTEARWQDVPDSSIAENPGPFNFFDPAGFRYYLPAAMSWAVRNYADDDNDSSFFTYLAVLPTVAPREIGRGLGEEFYLEDLLENTYLPRLRSMQFIDSYVSWPSEQNREWTKINMRRCKSGDSRPHLTFSIKKHYIEKPLSRPFSSTVSVVSSLGRLRRGRRIARRLWRRGCRSRSLGPCG